MLAKHILGLIGLLLCHVVNTRTVGNDHNLKESIVQTISDMAPNVLATYLENNNQAFVRIGGKIESLAEKLLDNQAELIERDLNNILGNTDAPTNNNCVPLATASPDITQDFVPIPSAALAAAALSAAAPAPAPEPSAAPKTKPPPAPEPASTPEPVSTPEPLPAQGSVAAQEPVLALEPVPPLKMGPLPKPEPVKALTPPSTPPPPAVRPTEPNIELEPEPEPETDLPPVVKLKRKHRFSLFGRH